MNRGIARRTLFERREDFRYFSAQLARAVHRGEIEVHAFCLMTTHYPLLVRSPRGELARAMGRAQLAYSRWFNRSRQRDGSLVAENLELPYPHKHSSVPRRRSDLFALGHLRGGLLHLPKNPAWFQIIIRS